jgi:Restriction endonuclease NotI
MAGRATPPKGHTAGNFVAEWFGHRVWPRVDQSLTARTNQSSRACPFLTAATSEPTGCVKFAPGWTEPYGVCTISSDSNGSQQDWIACPYRTFDQHFTLLATAVRAAYGEPDGTSLVLLPLTVLHREDQRQMLRQGFADGARVFLFSAQKLGGEIDLPETDSSPGAAVDMSVIEVTALDAAGKPVEFGKHLFYEIQTADFHGSPLHAAKHLRESCAAGEPDLNYHATLADNIEIAGTGVEGPNKANIFKRTIYQMIFKIELARHADCAGFAIVLPVPVWDSWLRHLGQPSLVQVGDDPTSVTLPEADPKMASTAAPATIYVFDIDSGSAEVPSPLRIVKRVSCSAAALAHYAFTVAADKALKGSVIATFRSALEERVTRGWNNQLRKGDKKRG